MNQVYTHPGQPQMQAEVILASRHARLPNEKPLVTMRLRYPRIIHAEAETHRIMNIRGQIVEEYVQNPGIMSDEDLSRNARSSRAVPVRTMLEEVKTTPFVPWHWGKNQKGMQAGEECNAPVYYRRLDGEVINQPFERESVWRMAAVDAARSAEAFMEAGYHKQIANRLLEPFSWIDTLITANDWDNFLWLRDHGDAEPHLQDLARLVRQALGTMEVQELKPGQWHVPYITEEDSETSYDLFDCPEKAREWLRKISAARCAWISYKPFGGGTNENYERELKTYNMLLSADRVHASPFEHQATPDTYEVRRDGWGEPLESGAVDFDSPHLHGNLKGWIQARKLIPNERYVG